MRDHKYTSQMLERTIKTTDRMIYLTVVAIIFIVLYTFYISDKAFSEYGEDRYFFVDDIGAVKEVLELDKAHKTEGEVIKFTHESVTQVVSMAWSETHLELNKDKRLFTSRGFKSFLAELAKSQWVARLQENRENVSIKPLESFVVTGTGVKNGVLYYSLRGKYQATFEGAQTQINDLIIDAIVRNVPYTENHKGLAFDKLSLTEIRKPPDVKKEGFELLEKLEK